MCTPRAYLGVQALGRHIYAIGGHDGEARVASVERYDVSTDAWSLVASMRVPRAFLAAAATKSCLLALGGSSSPGHALDSCEAYDAEADTWTEMPMRMAEARCFLGAVAVCVH